MARTTRQRKDRMPPKEVLEWMRKKTDDTFEMNKGNLDKQSFFLGMMCMWNYCSIKIRTLNGASQDKPHSSTTA